MMFLVNTVQLCVVFTMNKFKIKICNNVNLVYYILIMINNG